MSRDDNDDDDRDAEPARRSWFNPIFLACCILLLVGLLAFELGLEWEPAKSSVVFFLLFWLLLPLPHTLAHILVALLLGWRVGCVVLGFGPRAVHFTLRKVLFDVRWIPVNEAVQAVPGHLRMCRLIALLIALAGPAMNFAWAFMAWTLLGPDQPVLGMSSEYVTIAWQCLFWAALVTGILNLLPGHVSVGQHRVPNDGLTFFQSLTRPWEDFPALQRLTFDIEREVWQDKPSSDDEEEEEWRW